MTAKSSEKHAGEVSRFSVGTEAEVTFQIAERAGRQFIVIKEQHATAASNGAQQAIEIPAALLPELKRAVAALERNFEDDADQSMAKRKGTAKRKTVFAHESEEEFARILDFYHIAWEYEPRTFALEWDEEGNVATSFTPDFYLTEHDLYIELTTLRQSLVTKKNRKVRLLKKLYPTINIKVLYASDYRKLVEKFAASKSQARKSGTHNLTADKSVA